MACGIAFIGAGVTVLGFASASASASASAVRIGTGTAVLSQEFTRLSTDRETSTRSEKSRSIERWTGRSSRWIAFRASLSSPTFVEVTGYALDVWRASLLVLGMVVVGVPSKLNP
jgi:hypothetical protein